MYIRRSILLLTVLALLSLNQSDYTKLPTRKGKDFALFFAVNQYDHSGLRGLNNPIKNAEAIGQLLKRDFGFEIEIVRNPTLVEIENKLITYRDQFGKGHLASDGQLFISFSGHGMQELQEGYFLPRDADPDLLRRTALPYSYWRNFINKIDCDHILVAVDACYSVNFDPNWQHMGGKFGRPGELNEGEKLLLKHQETKSRLFFTSDGKGGQTPDKSNFAKKLQEGLLSSLGADRILTSSDVFANLSRATPTPHRGEFGDDEAGSSFLFIRKAQNALGLEDDAETWQRVINTGSVAAYESYLKRFPEGSFTALANQKIDRLIRKQDLQAWKKAQSMGTTEAYHTYMKDYPKGLFNEAAKLELNKMRKYLPTMIYIKGGQFVMGSNRSTLEQPIHKVHILDFYLAEAEITNEQFCVFLNLKGNQIEEDSAWLKLSNESLIENRGGRFVSKKGYENHPVIEVSWHGAKAYCEWVSEITGQNWRLPTEAEWEYAAGGGLDPRTKWAGTNGLSIRDFANYNGVGGKDRFEMTAPIKKFNKNTLSLYDLSGNVWEWCADEWHHSYHDAPLDGSKWLDGVKSHRVIRGGSWGSYISFLRISTRIGNRANLRSSNVGFRPARDL